MTPFPLLLSAWFRGHIVQPYPTGPMRKAEPCSDVLARLRALNGAIDALEAAKVSKYIGWGACTMPRDHRYENASACLEAGDYERASWWVLAMTYRDERAHLTIREDV